VAIVVERLTDGCSSLAALVSESEEEGLRFVRRLVDDWDAGTNRFDRPGEALFVARLDTRPVGVCGLNVDPYLAETGVGRVRHLYVLPARRRVGTGRQLLAAVLGAARPRFRLLRLRTSNPAAARLYESLGFRPVVGHHDCTHVLELTS